MKKTTIYSLLLLAGFCLPFYSYSESIDISGVITDGCGYPVVGAKVMLSTGDSALSDTAGKYLISVMETARFQREVQGPQVSIDGKVANFDIFQSNGRRIATVSKAMAAAGERLTEGLYVVRLNGEIAKVAKVQVSDGRMFLVAAGRGQMSTVNTYNNVLGKRLQTTYTMRVTCLGYSPKQVELYTLSGIHNITLESLAGKSRPLTDYGTLVEGSSSTDEQAVANARTIQRALDSLGKAGGGCVCLPAGTYRVKPSTVSTGGGAIILVNHNNLHLRGAGMGKTKLSCYSVDVPYGSRKAGIKIKGTYSTSAPRVNVILSDFELSGELQGHTGRYDFAFGGEGWDMNHKGIIVTQDDEVDKVVINRVYVHDFRGEVVYGGGHGLRALHVANSKIANSNADLMSLAANLICENVEFDNGFAFVENIPGFENQYMKWIGCTFRTAHRNGLCITQSPDFGWVNGTSAEIVGCTFMGTRSPGSIELAHRAQNIKIYNNHFIDNNCCVLVRGPSRNIDIYDNRIECQVGGAHSYALQAWGGAENLTFRNNYCIVKTASGPRGRCYGYAGSNTNVSILNNTFIYYQQPDKLWGDINVPPTMSGNDFRDKP